MDYIHINNKEPEGFDLVPCSDCLHHKKCGHKKQCTNAVNCNQPLIWFKEK